MAFHIVILYENLLPVTLVELKSRDCKLVQPLTNELTPLSVILPHPHASKFLKKKKKLLCHCFILWFISGDLIH